MLELRPGHAGAIIFDDDSIGVWLDEDVHLVSIGIIGIVDQLLKTRSGRFVETGAERVDNTGGYCDYPGEPLRLGHSM